MISQRRWRTFRQKKETMNQPLQHKRIVPLYSSATGQWIRIHSMPPGSIRAQFIRIGIGEGVKVKCLERLPGGTIVLQKNRQQIAIGHQLAKHILVVILEAGEV